MRIVEGADWRDELAFDQPVRVSEIAPGGPARCAECPSDAALLPRDELWAVKRRHPTRHGGYVRFFCATHRPAPPAPAPAATAPGRKPARREPVRRERTTASRASAVADTPRAVCPNCFVEVPATGVCGMCGERVG
ncbi:glucose-6-phosphate dehydrogenase [Microbacterium sp. X-17]|uniref:glucose-6-phosphate dehydrogenase n=1 Tax=Microbacterium sp. X-17 TaxID=3144404 RepID=UPI0031F48C2C